MAVEVAIPTRNGAADLERTLAAVARQTVPAPVVVLDSSSTDGTAEVARRHGATVHVIPAAQFGHGRSRNRLMELTGADRVAFLTQDAEPADERWLERLTAPGGALTFGPYRVRPETGVPLRREYAELFAREPDTFVSSANLSLSRAAWSRVPFRDVAYAEDQRLALDLRAAGEDVRYVPEAAVLHAHEYGPVERGRRYFDEFRALHELYGWRAPASPRIMAGTVRAEVRKDRAFAPEAPVGPSLVFHTARVVGAALGTRADRLPAAVRRRLSLEGRA